MTLRIKGRVRHAFALAGLVLGMTFALYAPDAHGAPGDLDPTFGNGGKATLAFGTFARATAAAFDAQGRIVVAGEVGSSGERDMGLARFTADGQLDTAFAGSAGSVTRDPTPTGQDYIDDLHIQSDGKILVGGTFDGAAGILRYLANGLPDAGFGSGGEVRQDYGYLQRSGGLIPLPNGQLHWYGWSSVPTNLDLLRFDADGGLDTGFGMGGHTQFSGGTGTEQYHFGLRLANGKLLIGGETGSPNPISGTVIKLHPDGTPDAAFGSGGKASTGFGSSFFYDVAIDSKGRIVTVGAVSGVSEIAVARLLPNGQPDLSFNGIGRRSFDLGGAETGRAVAIQANGKIVVAGNTDANGDDDMVVLRLNPDGTLDSSFGADGTQIVDFAGGDDQANDLLIQPDGSLILVGEALQPGSLRFGLARIEGDPPPAQPQPPVEPQPNETQDRAVKIVILGKRLRVNRRGVARLRLRCPATEAHPPCKGTLTLRTARKFITRSARTKPRPGARTKPRRLSLGRARYRIAAGKTKHVRLRIGRAKLRLLRANRRARRVIVIARTGDGAGNRSVDRKRQTVTFKGTRHKRR